MSALELQGVSKQYGTQIVLDDVSLVVHPNERIGLIGANGAGKTTLFRIMAGLLPPDLGQVICGRRVSIGMLHQEPSVDAANTLHDEVVSVFSELSDLEHRIQEVSDRLARAAEAGESVESLMAEFDRLHHRFDAAGGHAIQVRTNEILGGLGFTQEDHARSIGQLSGGQRCRAALAKLLLQDKDLLLLDEPTNHLDIDAVRWLEKFLCQHAGSAIIISHDRYLLDRLCTRIVELERRSVFSYPGNYSRFAETKNLRLLSEERQFEKDKAFIKKEQAFIAKHMAGQRTKEAQGRRKRLERRLAADEFVTETAASSSAMRLTFGDGNTTGSDFIRCDDLGMAFDDKRLFSGLSFQVPPGERLAITGPNGTGKTTLFRIIMGELEPVSGTLDIPPSLRIGYYAQEGKHLDPSKTVLQHIRSAREGFDELQARSFAARFLFTGENVFKEIGTLSGGEQSRVRLAALLLSGPDVLILDEPTNHLDIPSREVLEEALLEFSGSIIVISHDRYFLDRVAQRLLVIRPEGHVIHSGNYSSYIEFLEQDRARRESESRKKSKEKSEARKPKEKPARSTSSRFDAMSVEDLEAMVIDLECKLSDIQEKFGDPAIYKNPEELETLQEEQAFLEQELSEVDQAWQERAEE